MTGDQLGWPGNELGEGPPGDLLVATVDEQFSPNTVFVKTQRRERAEAQRAHDAMVRCMIEAHSQERIDGQACELGRRQGTASSTP